ncbi:MAG: GGDEF domain-containing protein [Moraxellaceae bacterium]|nr:GGDEF domain-containing protein [Moraxellaceae bacterium]
MPTVKCFFLAVSLISYYASKNAIHLALVEKELPLTSNAIYAELQKDLVRPFFISSMMASNTFLHDWVAAGEQHPELISRYLQETKDTYQVFTSFFVSDKTQRYYYPQGILKTVSPTDKADKWFYRVRDLKEPYEINIDYDQAHDNTLTIFMNFRVFNQQQAYLGATGVGLSMTRLYELLSHYEREYQKNIYLVDSTGRIRLTGNNRLHDNRSILQIEGLKDIADDILSRKKQDFQYSVKAEHYLLHVQYMPEVRLFLFVETEENKAIADVRHALYLNLIVFVLVVLATIVLTNMMVSFYQKKLAVMATIDHLTQLMNRQAFEMFSLNMLADSRRSHTSLAVMMIDIDHFKKVNDTYGHAAGDKVLQEVAAILKNTVREADLVCRWGGEEFVVFLHKCAVADAERIAEQLRSKVAAQLYEYELYHLNVTLSIGIASYRHDEGLQEVMARADGALYLAKDTGRNRVVARG